MATTAGMEFADWSSLPSLSKTIMAGDNPVLKTIGMLLSGNPSEAAQPEGSVAPGGYGITPPTAGVPPSGVGLQAKPFGLPALPKLGLQTIPAATQVPDLHSEINSFWGQ